MRKTYQAQTRTISDEDGSDEDDGDDGNDRRDNGDINGELGSSEAQVDELGPKATYVSRVMGKFVMVILDESHKVK